MDIPDSFVIIKFTYQSNGYAVGGACIDPRGYVLTMIYEKYGVEQCSVLFKNTSVFVDATVVWRSGPYVLLKCQNMTEKNAVFAPITKNTGVPPDNIGIPYDSIIVGRKPNTPMSKFSSFFAIKDAFYEYEDGRIYIHDLFYIGSQGCPIFWKNRDKIDATMELVGFVQNNNIDRNITYVSPLSHSDLIKISGIVNSNANKSAAILYGKIEPLGFELLTPENK